MKNCPNADPAVSRRPPISPTWFPISPKNLPIPGATFSIAFLALWKTVTSLVWKSAEFIALETFSMPVASCSRPSRPAERAASEMALKIPTVLLRILPNCCSLTTAWSIHSVIFPESLAFFAHSPNCVPILVIHVPKAGRLFEPPSISSRKPLVKPATAPVALVSALLMLVNVVAKPPDVVKLFKVFENALVCSPIALPEPARPLVRGPRTTSMNLRTESPTAFQYEV